MAWTSPRTWVAGAAITAAQMNAHLRDNLQALVPTDIMAWTSYTPTFTQSGAVTKTVTYAKYTQIGKTVIFTVKLTATGAGTANNKIVIGLPVTAATSGPSGSPIGTGSVFDTSAGTLTPGLTEMESTTTIGLQDATAQVTAGTSVLGLTGTAFALALASGDVVSMSGAYEAA
jgi:hypothetical protein